MRTLCDTVLACQMDTEVQKLTSVLCWPGPREVGILTHLLVGVSVVSLLPRTIWENLAKC